MLKAILPKSRCWCVDGESKFVLLRMGIRNSNNNTYWRIELPNQTDEEKRAVEEFIRVLEKILQYEKTPCPFKREHTVELPENVTPVKLRPWKPKSRPSSYSGDNVPSRNNVEGRVAARRTSYFSDRKGILSSPQETPTEEELGCSSSGSSVNGVTNDRPKELPDGPSDKSSAVSTIEDPQKPSPDPAINLPDIFFNDT